MNVCMYGGGLGQFADIRVGEGGGVFLEGD